MDTDLEHGLLFVAGGPTGQAYVYDTRSGETVATYQLGGTTGSFVKRAPRLQAFANHSSNLGPR